MAANLALAYIRFIIWNSYINSGCIFMVDEEQIYLDVFPPLAPLDALNQEGNFSSVGLC